MSMAIDRDVLIEQGFAFGKTEVLPVEDWETWTLDSVDDDE